VDKSNFAKKFCRRNKNAGGILFKKDITGRI